MRMKYTRLSDDQRAWLKAMADRKNSQWAHVLDKLIDDPDTRDECFGFIVCCLLAQDEPELEVEKTGQFDWIVELMLEDAGFIEIQLQNHSPFTPSEIDEISTTLLCKADFLSANFVDEVSSDSEREYEELKDILRWLLRSDELFDPKPEDELSGDDLLDGFDDHKPE